MSSIATGQLYDVYRPGICEETQVYTMYRVRRLGVNTFVYAIKRQNLSSQTNKHNIIIANNTAYCQKVQVTNTQVYENIIIRVSDLMTCSSPINSLEVFWGMSLVSVPTRLIFYNPVWQSVHLPNML